MKANNLRKITIATAQYPIERLDSFDRWEDKISRWIEDAAAHGAKLLVFPEYAGMELAGVDCNAAADLGKSLKLVADMGARYDAVYRQLAMRHDAIILAGSRPHRMPDGRFLNRAVLHCPDGHSGYQDKIVMTRFEREQWGVSGGASINTVDTPIGRIGISICYDSEFPLIARAQAEAGARIILVPSATDSVQGYWRVRIGSQARALENQCYVIQSSTVGNADWLPSLDENHGAAAVYCPPDRQAPDDGVIAVGRMSLPQWVYADIALEDVHDWRTQGSVLNFKHWPEQDPSSRADIACIPDYCDWRTKG